MHGKTAGLQDSQEREEIGAGPDRCLIPGRLAKVVLVVGRHDGLVTEENLAVKTYVSCAAYPPRVVVAFVSCDNCFIDEALVICNGGGVSID